MLWSGRPEKLKPLYPIACLEILLASRSPDQRSYLTPWQENEMVGGNNWSLFLTALYSVAQSNPPIGAVQIPHVGPHVISFCLNHPAADSSHSSFQQAQMLVCSCLNSPRSSLNESLSSSPSGIRTKEVAPEASWKTCCFNTSPCPFPRSASSNAKATI